MFDFLLNCSEVKVTNDAKNGIARVVILLKKGPDFLHAGFLNLLDILANCCPAIGVLFINKRPEIKPCIAVGLVEVALLELFNNDLALHLKTLSVKAKESMRSLSNQRAVSMFCAGKMS